MMNDTITRTFEACLESLNALNDFVTGAAHDAALDDAAIYAVQMAVEEAFSNIIQHAYGEECTQSIECTCRVDDVGLTIILQDEGRPFNPDSVPEPDLCAPIEERSVGGLGVYFIRQLMDEVYFDCRAGTTNVLTMVKHRVKA
ncbi:MAG: ATP-binding protein [Anaerolineae bacterium]